MVVCNECIKNVLNRIFLEGVARFGEPPQIYWDAIHALEQLDKTCLTINSTSDPNSPIGWRRNNYPILVVGKKNNKLKFSYTKKGLNSGKILITVEEVADVYGNILTENNNNNNNIKNMKQRIRLSESDLHRLIKESVKQVLTELDWRTYASVADKRRKQKEDGRKSGTLDRYSVLKLDRKANDLDIAAGKALSKKYGKNVSTCGADDGASRGVCDDPMKYTSSSNAEGGEPLGYWFSSSNDRDWSKGTSEYQDGDFDRYGDIPFDRDKYDFEDDEDYQKRLLQNKIGREVDDFQHGRVQYQKGKGWVKNN